MRDELQLCLEGLGRLCFDRHLDEIITVRKSPLFESHFMRKSLELRFPAQHAYRAHDAQFSKLDLLVELTQKALLVVREQLADGAVSLRDLVDFIAPLPLCTDNAAMIASAARYTRAIPFPEYLALDAYASAA